MGVKHLWQILDPFLEEISENEPENERIGVDASIWLYHFSNIPTDRFVFLLMRRIFKLKCTNNKLIFVFDGKPNDLKNLTLKKRREIGEKRKIENDLLVFEKEINKVKNIEKIKEIKEKYCLDKSKEEIESLNLAIKNFEKNDKNDWGINQNKREKELEDLLIYRYNYVPSNNLKEFEVKEMEEFSLRQIANLRKRNKITKEINEKDTKTKKVMSNYRRSYEILDSKKNNSSPNNLIEKGGGYNFNEKNDIKNIKNIKNLQKKNIIDEIFESSEEKDDRDKYLKNFKKSLGEENFIEEIKEIKEIDDEDIFYDIKSKEKDLLKKESFIKEDKIKEDFINKNVIRNKIEDKKIITENSEINLSKNSINSSLDSIDSSSDSFEDVKKVENTENIKKLKNIEKSLNFKEVHVSLTDKFKQILKLFNIPIINSIEESDSQLAYLQKENFIDSIISDDNDILIYGGEKIYKNWHKICKKIELKKIKEKYSQEDLIKMSILLGSDYTVGKFGYGKIKTLKEYKSYEYSKKEIDLLNHLYNKPHVIERGELSKNLEIKYLKNQKTNWPEIKRFIIRNSSGIMQKELILFVETMEELKID